MNELDLIKKYCLLKFHFSSNGRYKSYNFDKNLYDREYIHKKTLKMGKIFFDKYMGSYKSYNKEVLNAYLIYCTYNKLNVDKLSKVIESTKFRKFMLEIRNYNAKLSEDLEKINYKSFEDILELFYTNEISPISFYFICKYLYKDETIKTIKESVIYKDLIYKSRQLAKLFSFNLELIENTFKEFKKEHVIK